MLQTPPSDPTPVESAERSPRTKASAPAFTFEPNMRAGAKLMAARQQLGLSIQEVAERIRVRREFLEALEAMNVKLLPGKAYALAFLRSYARALGVDEAEIVVQFQQECALSREDAETQIRNPKSRPGKERPWLFAAGLALVALGIVGWRAAETLVPEKAAPAPSVRVATATSAPRPASAEPAPAIEARVVEIRAVAEAWLEARGPDGTVFLSRTLAAGDVYRPDASPGWTLHARDGGQFEVFINGSAAGLLGPVGQAVLGRKIDDIRPLAQATLTPPRS